MLMFFKHAVLAKCNVHNRWFLCAFGLVLKCEWVSTYMYGLCSLGSQQQAMCTPTRVDYVYSVNDQKIP